MIEAKDYIKAFKELVKEDIDTPILGVCLGHQAICEAFGGKIVHANKIMHGKKDLINIDNNVSIFEGLNDQIYAARYHSLIATDIPDILEVIAYNDDGIMGVKHKTKKIYGIQFHPESVMTEDGIKIIRNFLREGK